MTSTSGYEVIIDCGLSLHGGHHMSHMVAVLSAIRRNGANVYGIITNNGVSKRALDDVPVFPVFEATGYEGFPQGSRVEWQTESLQWCAAENIALRLLGLDTILSKATVIRVLNATTSVVLGVSRWLGIRGRSFEGQLVLYMLTGCGVSLMPAGTSFRLVEVDDRRRRYLGEEFANIGQAAPCFTLKATSPLRARELWSVTKRPVTPYTLVTAANVDPIQPKPAAFPRLLLYAGDAKAEKGLARLPALVKDLQHMASTRGIELGIDMQINDYRAQYSFLVNQLVSMALSSRGVSVYVGHVQKSIYRMLLAQAHVVVLLHTREGYHDMESGLANECFVSGIPVLCPQGTLPARQLLMYGGARYCYERYTHIVGMVGDMLNEQNIVRMGAAEIAKRARLQATMWSVI